MTATIVIKIGAQACQQVTQTFFQQLRLWRQTGKQVIVVHGGGAVITEAMRQEQLAVEKVDGLRFTNRQVLELTKKILLDTVQTEIVDMCKQQQISAVGIHAGMQGCLQGEVINQQKYGYVGAVTQVKTNFFEALQQQGKVAVVAPLVQTAAGQWLNVNADEMACKIAEAFSAEALYFVTDVPGIQAPEGWLEEISAQEAVVLTQNGVISGGMIPKIKSALHALKKGVQRVHITDQLSQKGTILIEKGESSYESVIPELSPTAY